MISFREILRALRERCEAAKKLSVGEVMVVDPVTASPDMDLDELRRLMVDHRSRYLPVLESGHLIGVVSFHDVAKAVLEEQSFENQLLKNYIRNWPEGEKAGE
jgi:CBS domain-containing protein